MIYTNVVSSDALSGAPEVFLIADHMDGSTADASKSERCRTLYDFFESVKARFDRLKDKPNLSPEEKAELVKVATQLRNIAKSLLVNCVKEMHRAGRSKKQVERGLRQAEKALAEVVIQSYQQALQLHLNNAVRQAKPAVEAAINFANSTTGFLTEAAFLLISGSLQLLQNSLSRKF